MANDWHSSLVPMLIKDSYKPKGQFTKAKVALCIHNIAFQVSRGAAQRGKQRSPAPCSVGSALRIACGSTALQQPP